MMNREMASGNTFAATALSSYGGFWLAFAIILTPGGFSIEASILASADGSAAPFYDSFGFFLMVNKPLSCFRPENPCKEFDSPCLTFLFLGLVYLHDPPLTSHAPLYSRLLCPLLLPRLDIPLARYRLSPTRRRRRTYCQRDKSGRFFWSPDGIYRLVQRVGRDSG